MPRLLSKHFCLQPFFLKNWVSLLFPKSSWVLTGEILTFGSPDPWKMHFQCTFWLQRTSCPWLINTIFRLEYYGLELKYTKSHHPNRCIKVGNKAPKTALFVVHTIFFVTRHDRVIWSCLVQTLLMYEQTLFSISNIQLEQQIHFLHNPFFIHPAIQVPFLSSNNEVKLLA